MVEKKSRGAVAPGKKQTNWRIDNQCLQVLEQDRVELGFDSIPALVNYLFKRYARGETIKRWDRK